MQYVHLNIEIMLAATSGRIRNCNSCRILNSKAEENKSTFSSSYKDRELIKELLKWESVTNDLRLERGRLWEFRNTV